MFNTSRVFKKTKMAKNIRGAGRANEMENETQGKGKISRADPILGDLEFKLPLMFRIKGTVINRIWWQILLVVIWSTSIVAGWHYIPALHFDYQPILIQLMGVVCGLLLAFRSNSAYDRFYTDKSIRSAARTVNTNYDAIMTSRSVFQTCIPCLEMLRLFGYWEGRKYWSSMTLGIRNLTRAIWINVKEESSRDIVEKKSAINLLIAFAIATKHYLREEYDYDFDDLLNITAHLDWLHTPSSTKSIGIQPEDRSDSATTATVVTVAPDLNEGEKNGRKKGRRDNSAAPKHHRFKAHDIATPTNIPLELSYYLSSYFNSIRTRDKVDPATMVTLNAALVSLVECLTGFERILRTPIPLAYSVHLHQSIWIYVLALPFQLVPTNGWATILVVGITAFFLLGILAIGWELENPFGYDDNDLPLDDFCKVLRREIEVIVSHKAPAPDEWVFKKENKPFAPECQLDAIELARKPVKEVLQMLADRVSKISEVDVLDRPVIERITRSAKRVRASIIGTQDDATMAILGNSSK